jgi:hypothetical protein
MRSPSFILKIAADSVQQLRRVDVFRVLDNCSEEEQKPVARFIVSNRPDLAGEISDYWSEVLPSEEHLADEDCIIGPENLCILCRTEHGTPCSVCGGKAFHSHRCSA